MTKKNLRPQQVAPVQRDTTANSSSGGEKGATALSALGTSAIFSMTRIAGK